MDRGVVALPERILCNGGGDGPSADGCHCAVDRVVADHGDASRQIHVGQGLDAPYDAHCLSAVDAGQLRMRLDERLHEVRGPSAVQSAFERAHNLDTRESLPQRALETTPAKGDARVPESGHHEDDLSSVRQQSAHCLRATAPEQVVVWTDVEEPATGFPRCRVELVRAFPEAGDRGVEGLSQPPRAWVGRQGHRLRVNLDMARGFAFRQTRELIHERKDVAGGQHLHRSRDLLDWPADGSPNYHPCHTPAHGDARAAGRDPARQRRLARQPESCRSDQARDRQHEPEVRPAGYESP